MVHVVYGLFCFVIGCCMGSFLGLCTVRLQREESLWRPRSHCDSCGHGLGVRELLPLIGYFLNDGRCRYCGALIPVRYFWQEAVAGLLFLLVGFQTPPGLLLLVRWGIASLLLLLSFLDMEELQLYEELFYPLGLLFLAYRFLAGFSLTQGAIGALVWGGGLELLRRFKPQSLGAGDPKLAGLLGFWLGAWQGGESLLWAVVTSFLFVLWRGFQAPKGRRMQVWCAPIPFGPFLCGAAFLVDCRQWGMPFGPAEASSLPLVLGALEISGLSGLAPVKERLRGLLQRLRPWPRTVLSVVLGPEKLVLLQGRRNASCWEVERCLEMVWPERLRPALTEGRAEDVARWLQEVCAKRGFTAKRVNLALAPEWTELRELSLTGLSWQEQQEEARWEIAQQAADEGGRICLALLPHPGGNGQVLAGLLEGKRQTFLARLAGLLDWNLLRVEPLAQCWGRWRREQGLTLLLLVREEAFLYGWFADGCLVGAGTFPSGAIPPVDQLPETVLLGGGEPETLEHWKEVLQQEWGCPVEPLRLEDHFRWAPCYEEHVKAACSGSLFGALGGLLSDTGRPGLSFSLELEKAEQQAGWLPRLARGALAGALALLLLGSGLGLYWHGQVSRQRERLQQASGWQQLWQEAQDRQQKKAQQQQVLQLLAKKQLPWTPLLTLLGNTLPADCQVVRLQQETGKEQPGFSLEGRSRNRQAVLQFTKRLQKEKCVTGVRLEQLEEQPGEPVPVRFALHGWWKAGGHES